MCTHDESRGRASVSSTKRLGVLLTAGGEGESASTNPGLFHFVRVKSSVYVPVDGRESRRNDACSSFESSRCIRLVVLSTVGSRRNVFFF